MVSTSQLSQEFKKKRLTNRHEFETGEKNLKQKRSRSIVFADVDQALEGACINFPVSTQEALGAILLVRRYLTNQE